MKKTLKVLSAVTAFAIIGSLLYFANGFMGNPISKYLAKKATQNYINENYAERDFIIEDVNYSFKETGYNAHVKSPSSIDTYFTISISMLGKVKHDTYNNVLSGWNTYMRIEDEYRQMVNEVFSSPDFPLESHIDFGTIEIMEEELYQDFGKDFGIKMNELVLDKEYDVKNLAKTAGKIVFYAQDDEISFKRASELLLILKEALDSADVPFYAIDFVLEKPRNIDGAPNSDNTTIHTANFLYKDIYEEGLEERVEKAHNALMDYYKEQDEKI